MTYEDNYLAHYGVPKMKWGIRRYQNKDGTLTELGKKHYGKDYTKQTSVRKIANTLYKSRKNIEKNSSIKFKIDLKANKLSKKISKSEDDDPESKQRKKLKKLQDLSEQYSQNLDHIKKLQALSLNKAFAQGYTRKFQKQLAKHGLDNEYIKRIAENQYTSDLLKDYVRKVIG